MNESELKNIWKSYDSKIEKVLAINKQQLHELQSEKAGSKIQSFIRNHILVMLLGLVWIFFLSFLVYHTRDNIYFTISVGAIILFNVFAVLLYLRHIIILSQIDISESITATQQKLAQVYTSYTQAGRVLLLQAPFFCTWWYTEELVQNGGVVLWSIQIVVVAFFSFLAIYLFRKLSMKNPSDKWRKLSNKHFGAEKLQKAMDFLKEIEDYKKEDK
ncbi:hypothetical protein JKA74_02770 [Marivirga sp. S37H4]|uniref:Uncharacterized protein n=1 Tax=Marivirga aurantiaca TaxID=2802615 RepID=A0A934WVZ5_9BACT|nr:hypothetical protein [Marivirga aurantiaca]MBK6263947.1 hypothetical protein [Marivirga aurantiaca]